MDDFAIGAIMASKGCNTMRRSLGMTLPVPDVAGTDFMGRRNLFIEADHDRAYYIEYVRWGLTP